MGWVARRGRRPDGRERGRRIPVAGCNDRATQPAALLPRAVDGCVDFGVGLRYSLGRDRTGYRRCASRLGQHQNPQQRGPSQYFNSLLSLDLGQRRGFVSKETKRKVSQFCLLDIGGLRGLREIVMPWQPGGVFAESSSLDAALQILLTSFNVSKEISRSVKCRSSNA